MDIRQCIRCSKLFQFRGNVKCPACVHELDEIFLSVRNYLDDNPQASIEDVCEFCGADEEDVLRWLREGRLILTFECQPLLTCQLCQESIKTGRYCEACSAKVIGQLENTSRHLGSHAGKSGGSKKEKEPNNTRGRSHVHISE